VLKKQGFAEDRVVFEFSRPGPLVSQCAVLAALIVFTMATSHAFADPADCRIVLHGNRIVPLSGSPFSAIPAPDNVVQASSLIGDENWTNFVGDMRASSHSS
jgi:hypothetical protein